MTVAAWAGMVQDHARQLEVKLRRAHEADDRQVGDILRGLLNAVGKAEHYLEALAQDRREDARERRPGPEVA